MIISSTRFDDQDPHLYIDFGGANMVSKVPELMKLLLPQDMVYLIG